MEHTADHEAEKTNGQKQPWCKPELRTLHAGSAEDGFTDARPDGFATS
jgi:hypothetical protein